MSIIRMCNDEKPRNGYNYICCFLGTSLRRASIAGFSFLRGGLSWFIPVELSKNIPSFQKDAAVWPLPRILLCFRCGTNANSSLYFYELLYETLVGPKNSVLLSLNYTPSLPCILE
jgi:hypothetical protein